MADTLIYGRLSIIVPALNEADEIVASLKLLQPARKAGHELIVVDGGSSDDTVALAEPFADKVIRGPRGRARQMNAGAAEAAGDVLWFVHADTRVPPTAFVTIGLSLSENPSFWGRFDVKLSGYREHPTLGLVGRMINWRSRRTGLATGDQAIFLTREGFEALGGYPDIPLMEDLALSRTCGEHAPPICLTEQVMTSSRRWEEQGIWKTILLMWRLRVAWQRGTDPVELHHRYYGD